MKIERVVLPYTGSELGGSHISSFTLGQALQRDHGIEAVVYANKGTLIVEEATRRGLTVRTIEETIEARHNPVYDALRLPARYAMLRREGPATLLHSNDIGSLQAWGPVAKLLGLPVVYHNRAFNRPIAVNRVTMRLADRMICVSHAIRARMTFLDDIRVKVVDNPFELIGNPDRRQEKARLAADLGLDPARPIIGFAANFWQRKRPIFFIDVSKIMESVRPGGQYVVFGRAGDITQADLLRHAETIGIASSVTFAGFRLPGESNIAAMDLHLIPAVEEPFGRTPIESLLIGTPYVGIADGGNREIGERFGGGVMLPPDVTEAEFAEVSIRVLAEPDAVSLTPERREKLARQLSARNHVERVVEIYREAGGG